MDSLTSHPPAFAAPADNQRRSLPRHPQPEPLLLAIGSGRWLHEATTLEKVDSSNPAPLAPGVRWATGSVLATGRSIVLRLVGAPDQPTRAVLETADGPVEITVGTGDGTTWTTGRARGVAPTPWVELRLSPTSSAMVDAWRRPVESFPGRRTTVVHIDPRTERPQAAFVEGEPSDPPPISDLVDATIERLDQLDWRTFGDWTRPVEVYAVPDHTSPPVHPGPRIELLGWLSEGWEGRRSGQWAFRHRRGGTVSATAMDDYGRAGGLVVFAREPDAAPPPASPAPTVQTQHEPLMTGDRSRWMAAVRHCDALLYQLAATAYREDTAGDRTSGDVTALVDALRSLWHPVFAHHIDVVDVLARGLGRYRYSDPDHEERAASVLATSSSRLGDAGIASGPVVVS